MLTSSSGSLIFGQTLDKTETNISNEVTVSLLFHESLNGEPRGNNVLKVCLNCV